MGMAAGAAAIGDGDALAASSKIHRISSVAVRKADDIRKVYPIKKILVTNILMARTLAAKDRWRVNRLRSLLQIAGDESPGYVSTPATRQSG